jgi:hypothetical protein
MIAILLFLNGDNPSNIIYTHTIQHIILAATDDNNNLRRFKKMKTSKWRD